MLYLIIGFLALSVVFYCLFGGADFGAGVLGLLTRRTDGQEISDVIGPVWEANHVWLILAVVILFMGFPEVYSTVTLYLHIPILLLLIGVIMRGTAFAFLHYDAVKDRSARIYELTFKLSSLVTPLFLGTIVGALMMGRMDPAAPTFYAAYMAPWMNGFAASVGVFTLTLFTFLAAVFMIGEVEGREDLQKFSSIAKRTQVATVLSGGLVFGSSWFYGVPLVTLFLDSAVALGALLLATASLAAIWYALNRKWIWTSRFIAGTQVFLILFAWFWVQHPVVVNLRGAQDITFFNSAAPASTLLQLLLALLVGACIILPSLYILYRVFKIKQPSRAEEESASNTQPS